MQGGSNSFQTQQHHRQWQEEVQRKGQPLSWIKIIIGYASLVYPKSGIQILSLFSDLWHVGTHKFIFERIVCWFSFDFQTPWVVWWQLWQIIRHNMRYTGLIPRVLEKKWKQGRLRNKCVDTAASTTLYWCHWASSDLAKSLLLILKWSPIKVLELNKQSNKKKK